MTATNMCSNFGSKWSSPPKEDHMAEIMKYGGKEENSC